MKPALPDPPPAKSSFATWFSHFSYNYLILPFLYIGLRLAAFFNAKIRRGIAGRKHLFERLEKKLRPFTSRESTILIHAASMGEYEQARPVIRELRRRFPELCIVASVFSPSAYDHIHDRSEADVLTYLPVDFRHQVRRFLDMVRPIALLVIRHDLWPNLLWEAQRLGIYTMLLDASVHRGSLRHRRLVRHFYRQVFAAFSTVCAISETELLRMAALLPASTCKQVCGDTRFDQVVFRCREKPLNELLPAAVLNWSKTWIAGSTWPEDERVVLPAFAELRKSVEFRLILVPHEPGESHLQQLEAKCQEYQLRIQRLSKFKENIATEVLLVDRVGILANLYAAGQVAFVGGSFGPGVHSVIEAAVHGLPVLFGPRMQNSAEAVEMVREGCGFMVENHRQCIQHLQQWFTHPTELQQIAARARAFVEQRTGASEKIIDLLAQNFAERLQQATSGM